ncbi:MAG: FtsX-like permease family protein [Prolixibacteraceae bacterium]|jgi:putative ABC transport system permease protein|nr:FtsX-like permease family protein [Prolixibacteraceae bacterium]
MIKFLIKGLLRDKSRSRIPVMVVAIGVMLTVFMHAFVTGYMGDTIEMNARFTHGHLKVMTTAYADEMNQMPNDLALLEVDELKSNLKQMFSDVDWSPRIQFGGLVDVPDANGETRSQGPAFGMALDFLSPESKEAERLNIEKTLVRGTLIKEPQQALLSEKFAQNLGVNPGDEFTLIGSTMNGSMAFYTFKVAGTITFGVEQMDRGALLVDINDAQFALDMDNAAGELIGFLPGGFYDNGLAVEKASEFNEAYANVDDPYAPVMKTLGQQGTMGQYVALVDVWTIYISMVFVFAMALVLWNAGLLGALRRYGEFGIRLAMGEEKRHVFNTLIYEAIVIGVLGSLVGTGFGLLFSWLMQTYGIDMSAMLEGATMMMPSEIKARITPATYYIGFIPGLLSTVIGAALAGFGIYKRKTSQLFKELEA